MRVSDIDRKAVETRLRHAHVDGSLTLDELDERLGVLWQTKTRSDLAVLTMDLPLPKPPPPPPPPPRPSGGRQAMKVLTAIWLSAVAVNATIWLILCVTSLSLVYPWFIWVMLPPGAVLGVLHMTLRSSR
jgi:hypothetical protein